MNGMPKYDKPDEPGMFMSPDETVVSIYHVVEAEDDFYTAAKDIFTWLYEAQQRFPDWPRVIYIDIQGHKGPNKGYSPDFFEFQQEFMLQAMGPYFTAIELPLTGPLINPDEQKNNVPERLKINTPEDQLEEGADKQDPPAITPDGE